MSSMAVASVHPGACSSRFGRQNWSPALTDLMYLQPTSKSPQVLYPQHPLSQQMRYLGTTYPSLSSYKSLRLPLTSMYL